MDVPDDIYASARNQIPSYIMYLSLQSLFRDSAFDNIVEVELEKESSRFIFQDILSCGRTAYGECFDYKYYNSLVQVRREGRLIYRDNTRYDPPYIMYGRNRYV